MKTVQQTDVKKRQWVKQAIKSTTDEKAVEAFRQFVADMDGKLYDYSSSNQFMLAMQALENEVHCFRFGSKSKWAELGRKVKSGKEFNLYSVLLPKPFEYTDEKTKEVKKGMSFFLKRCVINYADTESIDGKEFTPSFRTIADFEEKSFTGLFEKVNPLYPINFTVLDPSCGGFTDGKTITLNNDRDKSSQFCTLVHELSHCILDHIKMRGEIETVNKEFEAELSTVIYCLMSGIPAKGSAHYLDGIDIDNIDMKYINRAIKSSGKIYDMLHPKKESKSKTA